MSTDAENAQLKMDPTSLYREDVYTDRHMGTIRVSHPGLARGDSRSRAPGALPG